MNICLYLGLFCAAHLGQNFGCITVPDERRFKIVDPLREHGIDDRPADRLLARLTSALERERQMPLNLKRRAQQRGEQICRSRIENIIDRDFIDGAACEHPCDVFPLTVRHTFQGEDRGAIANLLHIWMAEIVALLGQKKAVAIAVKNV